MREIIIKNQDLKDLMLKRQEHFEANSLIQKQIEDLNQDQVKNGYKIEKQKEKMKPIVEEFEKEQNYSEFEYMSQVSLDGCKDDEVKMIIRDKVEDYIEFLREEKNKEQKNEK